MKKQILMITLFACTLFSDNAMCRHRTRVYAEEAERTYNPCWQQTKHILACPCSTICKHAIEGAFTGNLSLLKPHLAHVETTVDGKTLFDYMLEGGKTERYAEIYALLLAKGFTPYKAHGKRAAIYDIVDRQDTNLFNMSVSSLSRDKEACKELFHYIYAKIDQDPEAQHIFEYKALMQLARKNPDIAGKVVRERASQRRTVANLIEELQDDLTQNKNAYLEKHGK